MTEHNERSRHAVDDFIERYGMAAEQDGLPRTAGRMLALLIVEGGPFSFSELAERLQVSRGSVSTNTRLLEQFGVIERVAKPGDRQDYFKIVADPWVRLLEAWTERQAKTEKIAESLLNDAAALSGDSRKRVGAFLSFVRTTTTEARATIARLRQGAE